MTLTLYTSAATQPSTQIQHTVTTDLRWAWLGGVQTLSGFTSDSNASDKKAERIGNKTLEKLVKFPNW